MTTKFDIRDCVFSIPEAHAHLKISRSFLYNLVRRKKIKLTKQGSRTVILGAEIQRYMKSLAA